MKALFLSAIILLAISNFSFSQELVSLGVIEDGVVSLSIPEEELKHAIMEELNDPNIQINEVYLEYLDKNWFLIGVGNINDDNCYSIYFEIIENNNTLVANMDADKSTDTCTGKDCSHCKFTKGSGCKCLDDNWDHFCNHTTTGNLLADGYLGNIQLVVYK